MNGTTTQDVSRAETSAEAAARYGITRVPVEYFHYGNFRYTRLEDAIAQAKREQGARGTNPVGK